ncbi:hypothetical protein [Halorubellus sp. PRR65]|uniref:hypothetical protein n=1 Tax=Halorubellus sp. PRR65 TaxID=3098148 RepID=UPI002B262DAB|nr:hypothetical protein [Halorubellus sp. PRR65]
MTDTRRDTDDESTPMRAVSHTNPYTNESMGSVFEHGVTIVADGGRRDAVDDERTDVDEASDEDAPFDDDGDTESDDATPMKDVSHEAPDGGHGNRMFERVGDTADVVDEE